MPALKESSQVYDPHLPVGERMTGKTAVVVNRCLREARFLEFCEAFIGVAWTVDRVCLELGACVCSQKHLYTRAASLTYSLRILFRWRALALQITMYELFRAVREVLWGAIPR